MRTQRVAEVSNLQQHAKAMVVSVHMYSRLPARMSKHRCDVHVAEAWLSMRAHVCECECCNDGKVVLVAGHACALTGQCRRWVSSWIR